MKKLNKSDVKTLILSSLGGTLEFYDFIIFAIFTPYFTHHFFPSNLDKNVQLLNSYIAFAAGYLARPLGAMIMGHFSDKFGRKRMFLLSIVLMVVPTFIFSIMPTYKDIGYFAILILLIIRFTQGVAIGAELPSAWVFVYEHSPKNYKARFLALLTCGVCAGILLGALAALFLHLNFSDEEIKDYAYRIPFFIGGIFGLISIYLRKFLQETPTFQKMKESKQISSFPLKDVIKNYKVDIALSMMITWVLAACVLVLVILMPNYTKELFYINSITNSFVQISGCIAMIFGLFSTGYFADRFKAASVCKIYAFYLFTFNVLCFYEMYVGKDFVLFWIFYLCACFFAGIVNFASIFMCSLYKENILVSGISFSYNLSYAISGFITPIVVFKLHRLAIENGGLFLLSNGVYMCLISILAFFCAVLFEKIKEIK